MSSATATRIISSKAASIPRGAGWLALTVVIVIAGIAGTALLDGPRVVSRVTVVNTSKYTLEVATAGAGRDGWTLLGATQPKSTSSVGDVADQGSEWVFRVRAQGVSGGEFVVTRDRLEQSRWRVTIPSSVIDRLESQRIAASPRIAR
jgi:hypothetical protein